MLEDTKDCKTEVASEKVMTPDGIAVDWVHDLIFWTDTGVDMISVVSFDNKQYRKTLIKDGLQEPRAIAVDPKLG